MQEDRRPYRVMANHQRRGHNRAWRVLRRHQITARIQPIFVDSFLLPDSFGGDGHRTLAGVDLVPRKRSAITPSASAPTNSSAETRCQKYAPSTWKNSRVARQKSRISSWAGVP